MKIWTVVIEITDTQIEGNEFNKYSIEDMVSPVLPTSCMSFRIMEIIEAPYGPQGVSIVENKK